MTSNAGAREMSQKNIGFHRGADISKGLKEVEKLFSPEFRNRLTETVSFERLSPDVMVQIVEKFIKQLDIQLKARKVNLSLSESATQWLATQGYDEIYGARPLARLIQRKIRQVLAEEMLFGKLTDGGIVAIDTKDDELAFEYQTATETAEETV